MPRKPEREITVPFYLLQRLIGWTHRAVELEVSGSMQEAAKKDVKKAERLVNRAAKMEGGKE